MDARDLIAPAGRLQEESFEGIRLKGYLATWLEQAAKETDDEDAQAAYAYARAYEWKADWWREQYDAESAGDTYSRRASPLDKAREYDSKAAEKRAMFERLTAEDADGDGEPDEREPTYIL